MNRRSAVRNIVIISAGASLLPACTSSTDETSLHLKNIPITGAQENMLADLTEAIIPKTNTFIGAKDLRNHEIVLIMMDDFASTEDEKALMNGMKSFEDTVRKKFNSSFTKSTSQEKNEILKQMEASKGENDEAAKFYKTVKRYTIQSFT